MMLQPAILSESQNIDTLSFLSSITDRVRGTAIRRSFINLDIILVTSSGCFSSNIPVNDEWYFYVAFSVSGSSVHTNET